MENKQKIKAISRIYKDLQEIESNPIKGLSICMPDENNPFSLHCNILILSGIYEGIMLHLEMHIPDTYPLKSPKMTISAGQGFDHSFHHHVFGSKNGGYTICIDLLDHGFFMQGEKTGWTPAYTLSTILVQMQVFFSNDHDLIRVPSKFEIDQLKKELQAFKYVIKTTTGDSKTHTFQDPYPPLTTPELKIHAEEKKNAIDLEKMAKMKKAYGKLTCFITRITPKDNESPMGFPLILKRDELGKIDVLPIMEVLSYEGFVQQIQDMPAKLENFDNAKLRTANGETFNYWLPFYVNEELYQKYRQIFLNSISVLKHGIVGIKDYDFDPDLILKIFPTVMNKMILALQTGALYRSVAAIEAYCYFLRLFLRFLSDFPQLNEKLNEKVAKALLNDKERNKANLGDMGEFLILLSLSNVDLRNKDIWAIVMKECTARKFLWVMKEMKENQKIFYPDEKERFENDPLMFFYNFDLENLKKFYKARKISSDLFLFNFAASRKFLENKEEFVRKIDENFGVIDEHEITEFLDEIRYIKNNVNTYENLFKFIGLTEQFSEPEKILEFFRESQQLSYSQNYNSLFFPDLKKEFLLKIENVFLLSQWFLNNEKNIKFFKYLMREKYLIFKIKDYSKILVKDKQIFAEYKNLPEDFFEVLDESPFFLKNFLSQHLLFNYITFLEGFNIYPMNSYSVLNKLNCLQEFQISEELCKRKLNFEGMIKSLLWTLIRSFHEILGSLSHENINKIILLQKFCFHYKIILKNYNHWGFNFNKVIPFKNQNMADLFSKDPAVLSKRKEFNFLEEEENDYYFLTLVVMMHLRWDGVEKNETNDFKELLKFTENYLQKSETSRYAIANDEILKKMLMLLILMKQLDQMEFEDQMEQHFYVFDRKLCLKAADFVTESWKNINKIMKTYRKS